jgi:hypothetical protein
MNEIHDLLERVTPPVVDPQEDVARGARALRRRRGWQISAAALSVIAVVGAGIAVQEPSGTAGAGESGFADQPGASTSARHHPKATHTADHTAHHKRLTAQARTKEIQRQLGNLRTEATLQTYHDVLAEHLDPTGDKLRLAQNEQGGTGVFGTKLDWDGGGMLMISVSTSWRTSDWNAYPPGPGQRTTFRGHEARELVDGADIWVAVEHDDGQVVMLVASPEFGNNGTSIPSTGLTTHQLLDAAADPRLVIPPFLR